MCVTVQDSGCLSATVNSSEVPPVWNCTAGFIKRLNYKNDEEMRAIIAPIGASYVTLALSQFDTEAGWDFFTVSSCSTIKCNETTELLRISGKSLPDPVTSNTGIMLVEWTSDGSVHYSGWRAGWSVDGKKFTVTLVSSPRCEIIKSTQVSLESFVPRFLFERIRFGSFHFFNLLLQQARPFCFI
jgi:hypothetical protein